MFVWDFGMLHLNDEIMYIENILQTKLINTKLIDDRFRQEMIEMIILLHKEYRVRLKKEFQIKYNLRDINRIASIFDKLIDNYQNILSNTTNITNSNNNSLNTVIISNDPANNDPYLIPRNAITLVISIVYEQILTIFLQKYQAQKYYLRFKILKFDSIEFIQ
jgi:hypothetical protein